MTPGLLFPLRHHVIRRIVWERNAWLSLRGGGSLPEMVMIARHTGADPQPVPPWEWQKGSKRVKE